MRLSDLDVDLSKSLMSNLMTTYTLLLVSVNSKISNLSSFVRYISPHNHIDLTFDP